MAPDLTTTNVLLGIMAAVSLLEGVAVIGVMFAGILFFHKLIQVVGGIEERQVAPAVSRVNAILEDVKGVTSTVRQETSRIDRLLDWIIDAVERRRQRTGNEPSNRVM